MLYGLSLFSGYAGIDLALKDYVTPIGYCDIEEYAQAILLSRMDDETAGFAPIWTDVRKLDGRKFRGMVDIILAGFPCQGNSTAGKGRGLADERTGLFYEIVRIAQEATSAFIFLENVAGIRTKESYVVKAELARIGYDCRWGIISASSVGAKHERKRYFCLALRRDLANSNLSGLRRETITTEKEDNQRVGQGDGRSMSTTTDGGVSEAMAHSEKKHGTLPSRETEENPEPRGPSEDVANTTSERQPRSGEHVNASDSEADSDGQASDVVYGSFPEQWKIEPPVGRVVNGASTRPHDAELLGGRLVHKKTREEISKEDREKWFRAERLKACGNGVVPLQVKTAFEYLMGIKNVSV